MLDPSRDLRIRIMTNECALFFLLLLPGIPTSVKFRLSNYAYILRVALLEERNYKNILIGDLLSHVMDPSVIFLFSDLGSSCSFTYVTVSSTSYLVFMSLLLANKGVIRHQKIPRKLDREHPSNNNTIVAAKSHYYS